jgi:hypothetical protein
MLLRRRFGVPRPDYGAGFRPAIGLGALGTDEPFRQFDDIPQTPPIGHPLAPNQRVCVDSPRAECTHQLTQIHGDRLPARDVDEPASGALNGTRRI